MSQKQHSSKSLGLKLDLSSIVRSREYSMPGRQEHYTALPDQRRQKVIFISISSINRSRISRFLIGGHSDRANT